MASNDIVYIASGFYDDCMQLLELFKRNESYTFEAFCTAWQEMKFSLVFLCRKTYAEMYEFCEEALNIAKQIMLTSLELIDQVGGLYILYGLYYKIPIENIKIRVTLKEWQTILIFHKKIKQEEFYDTSYVFVKLVTDNAFCHCLFENEYGIEKSFHTHQEMLDNPYSVLSDLVQEIECGEFSKINEISKVYEEQKAKLLNNSSHNKLQLYNKSIYDEVLNEVEIVGSKRHIFTNLRKKSRDISTNNKEERIKTNSDNKIRPKLGHAFDTDSSDDEEIDIQFALDNENKYDFAKDLYGDRIRDEIEENYEESEERDEDTSDSSNDYSEKKHLSKLHKDKKM